jgi:hypothetical protein
MALPDELSKFIHEVLELLEYFLRFFLGQRKQPAPCYPCPPALKKPDPFIYSQQYLMSLGYPVTWDNPDIYLFDGNLLVNPHNLKASTPYTVVARIWNNSTDIPVIGLTVNFSYLSFGMGTQSNQIGTSTTDVSVKGLPGCPAFAYISWITPPQLGHYCLQVLLEPPDDSNWQNNLGQRNIDVAQPHSPATFSFSVGNHIGPRPRIVHFTVDTYSIPPLPRCEERGTSSGHTRPVSKVAPPIPDGWTVVITPKELELAPGEEKPVHTEITPPPGFSGSMSFNVTGHDNVGLVGGVTLRVEVP